MSTQIPERRGRNVALAGFFFQLVLALVFILLTLWSQSEAMRGLALLSGLGLPIWLFLILIYQQRMLVQEEAFETDQLRQRQEAGHEAIFDVTAEELLLAQRRLRWMYQWMLPAFSLVIIAGFVIGGNRIAWGWSLGISVKADPWPEIQHANLITWLVGGAAFLSFLFSRYGTGMARQAEWRLLRAGASYLMGITLAAAALTFALGVLHFFQTPMPERMLAYVLRILLFVLAAEFGLNFFLDLYRPRAPEEEPRPAFDSRLLGLFSEPGGLARSIAEAINYQFGFEVSSTWFYQLMQRAVTPLIGFAVATLFAATCMVFVEADAKVVVERFGKKVAVLEPGPHLKYPWPIDISYKVETEQIHELKIGIARKRKKQDEEKADEELILWTNEHQKEPHVRVLVATPKLAEFMTPKSPNQTPSKKRAIQHRFADVGEAVPVSMLRVSVTLQYIIRDAYQWITTYKDPETMIKAIAEREIARYCASVDVANLMGTRRAEIERALWETIQEKLNAQHIGVDVEFLGLQGVHPPTDTAEAFQNVIGAEQKKLAAIHSAESHERKRLTEVAGDVDRARQLAEAIREVNRLDADSSAREADRKAAEKRLHQLFFGDQAAGISPVGGEAAGKIVEARALRWMLENTAHGGAAVFVEQMAAKAAAPRTYHLRKLLQAFLAALPDIRKYVVAVEGQVETPMFNLNLQDSLNAPIDVALEATE